MSDIENEDDCPVDLRLLRDITDGEKEIEKELFDLFFSNAIECISVLENNCTDGENSNWRSAAHELKGSSASLGATHLSKLCHHAQVSFGAPAAEKADIVKGIKASLEKVKHFLENLSYS